MARDCIVLLAHAHDIGARTVAGILAGHGSRPFVVRPEQLATTRWSHSVDTAGWTRTTLSFNDGRSLADTEVGSLLNRLDYLPVSRFDRSAERDRDYAAMEVQALVASWLAGLGPRVVNKPTARATDGGPSSNRLWLALAATHDLPVGPSAVATSARALAGSMVAGGGRLRPLGPFVPDRAGAPTGRVPVEMADSTVDLPADAEVVVAGARAVGPLAGRFGAACIAATAAAGCRLAGFQFTDDGDGPVLQTVTTRPALRQPWATNAVADLLATVATSGSGAP